MWGNNLAKVGLDVYMIPSSSSSSRRIYYSFELPKKANCTIHKKEDFVSPNWLREMHHFSIIKFLQFFLYYLESSQRDV